MRANIQTLLTLKEYFDWLGLHPYYASQIFKNVPARSTGDCKGALYQEIWQDKEHISRDEFATSIARAEELFARVVGYWPAPKYFENELVQYPQDYQLDALWASNLYTPMYTMKWKAKAIKTKYNRIQATGTEVLTLIEADVDVVFSDPYTDGIDTTFTVTVTVPDDTDASTLALFFNATDRGDVSFANAEIKPFKASVDGTTATLTGIAPVMVLPVVQERLSPNPLDATLTATIYADTVDVYTRTTDTSDTGLLVWENLPDVYCDTDACTVYANTACFIARDKDNGYLAPVPATYSDDLSRFQSAYPLAGIRTPDRLYVNYLAGYPRQSSGLMDEWHKQVICLLATALLPQRTCSCSRADNRLQYYRDPIRDSQDNLIFAEENFGVIGRGAVEAARMIRNGNMIQYGAVVF